LVFTSYVFTKLAAAERRYVEILDIEFHRKQSLNVESTSENSFTP